MHWQQVSIALGKVLPVLGIGILAGIAIFAIRRRKISHRTARRLYRDAVSSELIEPTSLHPEIDPVRCAGCGACVRSCPEGEILQMINHKAVLVAPSKCVGHGECEASCPFDAISLVFGTKTRGMELPRISTNFETNVPGLYIAGELGGMGLIRNAIKQGRMAVEHAVKALPKPSKTQVDILIVGAGAAGLSAALAALQARCSYMCIEQGSVGGTVYNFPRQKIVMMQPAELPIVGTMKFSRNKVSKEELLAYWENIRRGTGLKIHENTRFINLQKRSDGTFVVETTKGNITAQKVILSMGVRGSPRRLGLANEDLAKVTYSLLEPQQYQRRHIAIVGGGNSAAEAAQLLADPKYRNKVTMLVRSKGFNRCSTENQEKIMKMAKSRLLTVAFNAVIEEIHQEYLLVKQNEQISKLANNYLFILAGTEMPFNFLSSLGIKIDKKFGEPLKKMPLKKV